MVFTDVAARGGDEEALGQLLDAARVKGADGPAPLPRGMPAPRSGPEAQGDNWW